MVEIQSESILRTGQMILERMNHKFSVFLSFSPCCFSGGAARRCWMAGDSKQQNALTFFPPEILVRVVIRNSIPFLKKTRSQHLLPSIRIGKLHFPYSNAFQSIFQLFLSKFGAVLREAAGGENILAAPAVPYCRPGR